MLIVHGEGLSGPDAAGRRVGLRARRDRRVHPAHGRRRAGRDPCARRLGDRRSTFAPTGCARSAGAGPRRLGDRYATMTDYQEDWSYPVAFPERPAITLAWVLADRGDRQLHVAETEKYPHVTYFFNGGEEHPYPEEERCSSPRRGRPDLRPQAGDERAEAAAAFLERRAERALPLRDHQLREPRHGRAHRQHPGGDRPSRPSTVASAWCWKRCSARRRGGRDRRPRQCRRDARGRGTPQTAHSRTPCRSWSRPARESLASPDPGGRGPTAGATRDGTAPPDDGPLAARLGVVAGADGVGVVFAAGDAGERQRRRVTRANVNGGG